MFYLLFFVFSNFWSSQSLEKKNVSSILQNVECCEEYNHKKDKIKWVKLYNPFTKTNSKNKLNNNNHRKKSNETELKIYI